MNSWFFSDRSLNADCSDGLHRVVQCSRHLVPEMNCGDAVLSVLRDIEMHGVVIPIGVEHKLISIPDSQPFPVDKIVEGAKWVEEKAKEFESTHKDLCTGRCVLVHCAEGNSRSIAVILALMLRKGMSLEDAIAQIIHIKPYCTENRKYAEEPQMNRIVGWGDFPERLEKYIKENP